MIKIAISYRRSDSAGTAGRIHDRLIQAFGAQNAFIDFDNIPIGVDFRACILGALAQCDVLLVIIGQQWLGITGQGRRVDDENDIVRLEIAYAINGPMQIVPILVHGASMPTAADLPENLKELAYRNAVTLDSGRDFHPQMDRLIRDLRKFNKPVDESDFDYQNKDIKESISSLELEDVDRAERSSNILEKAVKFALLNKISVFKIFCASTAITIYSMFALYYNKVNSDSNSKKAEQVIQSENSTPYSSPTLLPGEPAPHMVPFTSVEPADDSPLDKSSKGSLATPSAETVPPQQNQAESLFYSKPDDFPYAIQIAVRNSQDEVNLFISSFQNKYGDVILGYKFYVKKAEIDGKVIYRIRIVTPTKVEATKLCGKLKEAGGSCFIAKQ